MQAVKHPITVVTVSHSECHLKEALPSLVTSEIESSVIQTWNGAEWCSKVHTNQKNTSSKLNNHIVTATSTRVQNRRTTLGSSWCHNWFKADKFSGYLSSEDLEMSDWRELRFRRDESRLSLEPESSLPDSEMEDKIDL